MATSRPLPPEQTLAPSSGTPDHSTQNLTIFSPLLEPGIHAVQEADIYRLFVEPFSKKDRRIELVGRLTLFLEYVRSIGIRCEIWLNGSFTTAKPEPSDIDVVVFINRGQIDKLSDDRYQKLLELKDRPLMKVRYNCDVYVDPADDPERIQYWQGKFGRDADDRPKGIAVIRIRHDQS